MNPIQELIKILVSKTIVNQLRNGNENEFVDIQLPVKLPVDLIHAVGELCTGMSKEGADKIFSKFISNLIAIGFSIEAEKLTNAFMEEKGNYILKGDYKK